MARRIGQEYCFVVLKTLFRKDDSLVVPLSFHQGDHRIPHSVVGCGEVVGVGV